MRIRRTPVFAYIRCELNVCFTFVIIYLLFLSWFSHSSIRATSFRVHYYLDWFSLSVSIVYTTLARSGSSQFNHILHFSYAECSVYVLRTFFSFEFYDYHTAQHSPAQFTRDYRCHFYFICSAFISVDWYSFLQYSFFTPKFYWSLPRSSLVCAYALYCGDRRS